MDNHIRVLMVAIAMLAGCNSSTKTATGDQAAKPDLSSISGRTSAREESKDYYTALPLKEFMGHVMQYAADGVWKWQGYVMDKKGERSLFPKNAREWEEAESGARALAEITNVLLIPGRRIDEPDWIRAVTGVRTVALKAADAAERQDKDAFFAAGGELDEACESCHRRYDPTARKTS